MKRTIIAVLAVLCLATAASAQVLNGGFEAGLFGWTQTGPDGIKSFPDPYGFPPSPSGGKWVGAVSSWGGSWDGPYGGVLQNVNFTGEGILSGEMFAAARSGEAFRNCAVEVLWNGTVVANVIRAPEMKYAGDYPWLTFSVPVTGIGANELKVQWIVHFAEWTWVGADNLQVAAVPEPGSMLALLSGIAGLGGLAVRRRK